MQGKLSWSLFTAAASLFALIYFVERRIPGTAERREPKRVLPFTSINEIRAIEVTLPGRGAVRAERSNGVWTLTEPSYPARQLALDIFATNLVGLRSYDRISSQAAHLEGEKAFGLAPPQATVEVVGTGNRFQLEIGGVAPLRSNIYVRLPESGEVILATANILEGLPATTNDWRSPALFQVSAVDFDRIQVRSGVRSFELTRAESNQVWQITKPVPARADQDRVLELLQVLRTVEASSFVAEAPGVDLERYGLQAPAVEVSFNAGTNRIYSIEFGGLATNQTSTNAQVFVRLLGEKNVVLAPAGLVTYLSQPYKAFHDTRLAKINLAQLDRVVVHSREHFALQRQPRGGWTIDDQLKTPVDRELLTKFANTVNSLQILDIVREVPTDADLKAVRLFPPIASYAFFEKLTNSSGMTTNILFSELNFGGAQADKIFVRRSDETPMYQTQLAALLDLPKRSFELRDRRIWRFDTNTLVRLALSNGNITNQLNRTGAVWSGDSILNAQIDEVIFRLSRLDAQEWVDKGATNLVTFGVNDLSLKLHLEIRTQGRTDSYLLHFGRQTLRHDAYAAVIFPGDDEPTIFEFPGDLFQLMLEALPAPK